MEKQSIKRTTRFISRLLISFSLFSFVATASAGEILTRDEIKRLHFSPVPNQQLFTNTDIQFEINIPKVRPVEVQVLRTPETETEGFKSMKKFENFAEGGTKIQIWYSFEKTGTHILPPLKVMIQNRQSYLSFEPVTVTDDPAKKMPRIVLKFSNGQKITSEDPLSNKPIFAAKVGQKLRFTVYLQYIAQLVQFNYSIPKDSIYSQTRTYEITEVKYREKSISDELIPVADFEWTGLASGNQPIPKFKLSVISYGGYRTELILPEFKINFLPKNPTPPQKQKADLFADAFDEPFIESTLPEKIEITLDDCNKLAELHSQERNSVFKYFQNKKERIEMEEKLGLPSAKNTVCLGLLYFSIILIVLFLILLIISIKKKSLVKVFLFATLLFSSSILVIFTVQRLSQRTGISKGCKIYSIPEATAEASSEINRGNLVRITEATDIWYHIQLGESSGWCTRDDIVIIK